MGEGNVGSVSERLVDRFVGLARDVAIGALRGQEPAHHRQRRLRRDRQFEVGSDAQGAFHQFEGESGVLARHARQRGSLPRFGQEVDGLLRSAMTGREKLQLDPQLLGDALGDLLLQFERLVEWVVEAADPQLLSAGHIDQPRRDAELVARCPSRSRDDRVGGDFATRLSRVDSLTGVLDRGVAGGDS